MKTKILILLMFAALTAFSQRDTVDYNLIRTYYDIDTTDIGGGDRDLLIKYYSINEGVNTKRDTITNVYDIIYALILQAQQDSTNFRQYVENYFSAYKKYNTDYQNTLQNLSKLWGVLGVDFVIDPPLVNCEVPLGGDSLQVLTKLSNADCDVAWTTLPVQPKVLRALVNQSGASDPQTATSGTLTVGVSYEITTFEAGDDFTNVGAPSNANGVKFIATGTTPTVWTEGSTLAWDNGAPVLIIYENTIGNIWTLYGEPSTYYINSDALFTDNKTVITNGFNENNPYYKPISGNLRRIHNNVADNSTISLSGKIVDDYDSVVSEPDDVIYNWYIEILVYP